MHFRPVSGISRLLLLLALGSLSLTSAHAQLGLDSILGGRDKGIQAKAVQQAKQIGFALFSFDNDFGSYPGEKTVKEVQKQAEDGVTVAAKTANDCFFQLIVGGYLDDAALFGMGKKQKRIPTAGLKKLEKCFFSYISDMSTSDNSARPLIVAPLVNGKKVFDPKPLGGKAVVMLIDMSVHVKEIGEDGRVMMDGKDLFDPEQRFWGGKEPTIKWPEN